MGVKDAVAKMFFGQEDVLADLLNFCLFGGNAVVSADNITLIDGGDYRVVQGEDGRLRTNNRFRDLLARCDALVDGVQWSYLVGLELQSRDDRNMIPRIMEYDARRYRKQFADLRLNGQEIFRVINIIMSFDRRKHNGKSSLSSYMRRAPIKLDGKFYDYGYINLNIYELAEELDNMHCEKFRYMLNCFRNDMNGKPFENALKDTGNIGFVSRTMRLMQFVFLGLKGRIRDEDECEDEWGNYDMCKAINDIKRRARNEGRKNGLRQGREDAMRKMIHVLLERSFRPGDICAITGATEAMVREIAAQGNFVL